MSDKQKLEKIRKTLDDLDKEVADREVTRDYWDGFCKVFNAVEVALNENSDFLADRVVWELSNQEIFRTKDKNIITDCIRDFL